MTSFPNEPDSLHVSRYTDGSLIAVGVPWDSRLFFQEYWLHNLPNYAIANTSDKPAMVRLVEWGGEVGAPLAGPWTIGPNSVECFEIVDLMDRYSGSLVGVSTRENPLLGLLRAPEPFTARLDLESFVGVVTVEGLNAVGDRHANIWCLQPSLRFAGGDTVSILIGVPANTGTLYLGGDRARAGPPPALVRGASCKTLSVENRSEAVVVGAREAPGVAWHELGLSLGLPAVEAATLATLVGRVATRSGAGFSLARGFIVGPRT